MINGTYITKGSPSLVYNIPTFLLASYDVHGENKRCCSNPDTTRRILFYFFIYHHSVVMSRGNICAVSNQPVSRKRLELYPAELCYDTFAYYDVKIVRAIMRKHQDALQNRGSSQKHFEPIIILAAQGANNLLCKIILFSYANIKSLVAEHFRNLSLPVVLIFHGSSTPYIHTTPFSLRSRQYNLPPP